MDANVQNNDVFSGNALKGFLSAVVANMTK